MIKIIANVLTCLRTGVVAVLSKRIISLPEAILLELRETRNVPSALGREP
jgi:hypothetical protein